MTIDFDNLSIDAKYLKFDDFLGVYIDGNYGLFAINNNLESLNIVNMNTRTVMDMKLGFATTKIKKLAFINCDFSSVENLSCGFYQNKSLEEIKCNNNIIASTTPIPQNKHINKSNVLFPKVNNIENLFTECNSIKYLDFTPLFGDNYEVTYAFGAISFMEKLISVNFGGLRLGDNTDNIETGILYNTRHMILHACSNALIEYRISTDDKYTINELERQFRSILRARHK